MIPTLEEVMTITDPVSNYHVFQPDECRVMYETLCELAGGSTVVEIGCDFGRSSSLIFQMAKAKQLRTIHVDPWLGLPDRAKQWMEVMCERCAYHPFVLLHMSTVEAEGLIAQLTPSGIDLAFIDGSHDQPDVKEDLRIVASRVKPGGFLTAHDYPSAGVTEAIDPFTASGWLKYKQGEPGFGVWRKL